MGSLENESSMFTAQAVARHMNATGRGGDEVEQNRHSISAVVSDPPGDRPGSSEPPRDSTHNQPQS